MKDQEKGMLIGLAGVAIGVLSFFYVAKPNYETKQQLDAESAQLQTRLADLQTKQADREKYEQGIKEYGERFNAVLSSFPADLNQEVTIMFLQGIKDSNEYSISSLELGEKNAFYTLGSNGSDATLDTVPAEADAAADTSADAAADTAAEPVLAEAGSDTDDELTCYCAKFPLDYYGSYKSLKDVIAYVDNYSDRMTVDSLSIQYDGEEYYTGSMELSCYSIEGASRPERSLELNQVEIGVDNIFEGEGGASDGVTLGKYNENDGAAIETTYDFYCMLNPSTSDVSAKVVGQNGTGKESSVISNSDNTVSTISFDFYEQDGKNYCKYVLDNDKSYEAEVTSAEDVKLFIQSSARKNDEDQVGVKVTIKNSSSLPVYVKVSGDDSVSPRVSIAKAGMVKVYQ